MVFKDRADAGKKLARELTSHFRPQEKNPVIISLLRGGVVVGDMIARELRAKHLPLAVAKISAPGSPELAIGAVCFDITYLEKDVIDSLKPSRLELIRQIQIGRMKFQSYAKKFELKKTGFEHSLPKKTAILVDDGIATGSTMRAAALFVKKQKPKKIILASPVAPDDFDTRGFDEIIILHRGVGFSSVSQFYESFPQIEDSMVKKILEK